jgi:DNA repair protein RecO (recombination protein O)
MQISARSVVVAVRAHGEHGAIVRTLTAESGLLAGYVRGGRSRAMRPVLSVGNIVQAEFRARNETQLPSLAVELIESRAPLLAEPMAAAGIEWVTVLAAVALPEGHPYPALYAALDGVLAAITAAPSARGWVIALEQYEALMLSELGYGGGEAELTLNGRRLRNDLLAGRRADILPARDRLIERIDRALGR